nr:hypothetical protein HmN_000738500 [Hymenolepis microstoma]
MFDGYDPEEQERLKHLLKIQQTGEKGTMQRKPRYDGWNQPYLLSSLRFLSDTNRALPERVRTECERNPASVLRRRGGGSCPPKIERFDSYGSGNTSNEHNPQQDMGPLYQSLPKQAHQPAIPFPLFTLFPCDNE